MRLAAFAACNKLDISKLLRDGDPVLSAHIIKWLEQEAAHEMKWSEPRQLILDEGGLHGLIDRLLIALKTVSSILSLCRWRLKNDFNDFNRTLLRARCFPLIGHVLASWL